jgi:molecular chaperone IbpA
MTRQFDLTPLFRNSVGIDRLSRMLDTIEHQNHQSYPPYNIIATGEDTYVIEVAVAGFAETDIMVTAQHGELTISGSKVAEIEDGEAKTPNYLHQGISARKFQRVFTLADYVEVQSATVKDGILTVELERIVPDALKPKQIEVKRV